MSSKRPVLIPLVDVQEKLPASHRIMCEKLEKLKESARKDLMRVDVVRPTVHDIMALTSSKCYFLETMPLRKNRGRPRKNALSVVRASAKPSPKKRGRPKSVIKTSEKKRVPLSKRRSGNGGTAAASIAESSVSDLPEENGSDVQDGDDQRHEVFLQVALSTANGVSVMAKNVPNDGKHSTSAIVPEVDCVHSGEIIDMLPDPKMSTVDTPNAPGVEETKLTYVAPAPDAGPFIELLEARKAFSGSTAICDVIPDGQVQVVHAEVHQPPAPMVNRDAASSWNENLGDSNDAQDIILPSFCQESNPVPQSDVITFEVEENGVIVENFEVPVTFGIPPSGAVVMQSNGSDFPHVGMNTPTEASVLSSPSNTSESNVSFEVDESEVHFVSDEEESINRQETASDVQTSIIEEYVKPVTKFIPFFSKKSGPSFIKRKKPKGSVGEERNHGV